MKKKQQEVTLLNLITTGIDGKMILRGLRIGDVDIDLEKMGSPVILGEFSVTSEVIKGTDKVSVIVSTKG